MRAFNKSLFKRKNNHKSKIKRLSLSSAFKKYIIPLLLFFITFSIYLHHLSPSVYGGDVGDLVTAIVVKGVPHPSGYPLFTLLGIFFNLLPIGETPAWKVGLISVFSSSFSTVLFYLIVYELSKQKLVAFIGALTLAFTYPFWLYSELAELFSLNNFFVLLLFYLAIFYRKRKKIKYLYFLSFSLGLSLSHNEVIVLIFPSILFLMLFDNLKIFKELKKLTKCFFLFLLGLAPYLYIPIASSFNPIINWGNASLGFGNFIRLILRLDYGWGVEATGFKEKAISPFLSYLIYLKVEVSIFLIILSVLGFIYLLRKNYKKAIALFLAFLLSGPFYVFYSRTITSNFFTLGILERFYQISIIFILIFLTFGFLAVSEIIIFLLKKYVSPVFEKRKFYKSLFCLVFAIIPVSLFFKNFSKTDLHDFWLGDHLAYDILSSLPKNSLLFLEGDTVLFNTLYLQNVLGVRKDVEFAFLGPINTNTAYKKEEARIFRKSTKNYRDEIKFKPDFKVIQALSKKREVFSITEMYPQDKRKKGSFSFGWIPYGLVYKLAKVKDTKMTKEKYIKQQNKIWSNFRFSIKDLDNDNYQRSLLSNEIPVIYAKAYYEKAMYLANYYSDFDTSKRYCEKIFDLNPEYRYGYDCVKFYLSKKECAKAEDLLIKSLKLAPESKFPYVYLYTTHKECIKDNKKAQKISNEFFKKFNTKIEEEIKKEKENK